MLLGGLVVAVDWNAMEMVQVCTVIMLEFMQKNDWRIIRSRDRKINYKLMLNVETIDKPFFVSTFLIKSYCFDIGQNEKAAIFVIYNQWNFVFPIDFRC